MIKIENLHKNFGKLEVLKGIDLEVKKGEIVVIIGSSGTGKSTLLRCLNYLEKPEEGKITIGDITVDAKTCDKKQVNELRKHSAMIFQNYNLFLNKNVLQNVMEPLVTAKKMNKNEAEKVAKHYLEQVGMSDKLKQYLAGSNNVWQLQDLLQYSLMFCCLMNQHLHLIQSGYWKFWKSSGI